MKIHIKSMIDRLSVLALAALLVMTACLSGCRSSGGTAEGSGSGTGTGSEASTGSTATAKPRIAFTFDDGPQAPAEDLENGYYPYTTYVLDKVEALQKAGYRANVTFFVVGSRAASYPGALRRAQSLGCEIGSHTYNHDSFRGQGQAYIKDTLDRASSAIQAAGVPAPTLYRPVGGSVTADQLSYTASLGYTAVAWSIDSEDWKDHPKTADKFSEDAARKAAYEQFVEQKAKLILDSASDGDIVLLHDIYMSSVDIFIRAADELVKRGYELVTVSELLGLNASSQPATGMYIARGQTVSHMD